MVKTSPGSMMNILVRIFGDKHRDYIAVALHWQKTVGDFLAKYCRAVKIEKNILFVAVDNNVIMQELILIRDTLKERLNRTLLLNLNDIVFFINSDNNSSGRDNKRGLKN